MSLIKTVGAVDGIMYIKTHLRGAFGISRFLDIAFFSWNKSGMMCKKGMDLLFALHLPKHWQYPQLTIIWWICALISDVEIIKQFSFLLVFYFSLTYPWFFLEINVSFAHWVVMSLHFSSLLRSTLWKTLCKKDKYVLHSLT